MVIIITMEMVREYEKYFKQVFEMKANKRPKEKANLWFVATDMYVVRVLDEIQYIICLTIFKDNDGNESGGAEMKRKYA